MTNSIKARILYIVGLVIACGVPLVVALFQFPIWIAQGAEYTVSGIVLIFIPLCLIPFWRHLKEYFKNPSAWMLWLIIFAVFYAINTIIDQVVIISAFGAGANIIASVLFYLSKKIKDKPDTVVVENDE